ncbi:MAG: beta-ketoacyl-ACP synthase II [Alphaproteobacteria bacterium]
MRRVVVTGMGLLTPLGVGLDTNWRRLVNGESGVRPIEHFETGDLAATIAAQIPLGQGEGGFNPDDYVSPKEQRQVDQFIVYALAAAQMAVENSGWVAETEEQQIRTGVMIGSGIGGLQTIYNGALTLHDRGPRRVSPHFIPAALINLASGRLSIRYGFRGPNHAAVTACATGAHAIGDASRLIMLDDADVMVAGGSEAAICRIGISGFAASRALSTGFNDRPTEASRPWDENRDGFVMGEGSGIVVLEEYEHAKRRGANILAEVAGYGLSGDAHHITSPAENGDGAIRAMRNALKWARLNPDEVDYVNAHSTSTPAGDVVELRAIKTVYGAGVGKVAVSSTKSAIGHLLGAAGSVEAIYSILALRNNAVPPTLNLHDPSPEAEGMDLVPLTGRDRRCRAVMSNAFGFGGTNTSLVFRAID